MKNKLILFILLLFNHLLLKADNVTHIKIGVMTSGTLAWELAAINNQNLLANTNLKLETINITNQQAGKVALQSGSVDVIISDWIWVSSMRAEGTNYSFYPYSNTSGSLIIANNANIQNLTDLKGKKLGIAGGELDKNWLLLQALALKQGFDLNSAVEKVYGAPALLNEQLAQKRLDALLTYWQFAARFETQGYQQLLSGEEIVKQLGITQAVPSLGYVFKESWANENKANLSSFFKITALARHNLCHDDTEWNNISHLLAEPEQSIQLNIRKRYCQGQVENWQESNRLAAADLYRQLHKLENNKLTAKSTELETGTFWSIE